MLQKLDWYYLIGIMGAEIAIVLQKLDWYYLIGIMGAEIAQ